MAANAAPQVAPPIANNALPQALPQLAQAIAPVNRPTATFSQLFEDETKDPCRRSYRQVMTRYDASRVDATPSATLYQQVVDSGSRFPQAFLCCAGTANGPCVYCVHFPAKYIGAIDGTTSQWDDLSFAFLGEIVRGLTFIVSFPDTAFNEIPIQVKTLNFILQNLDDLNDPPVFTPVQPDEDDAEDIITRSFMFLPSVYVPLLLNASGYMIRQLWDILYPALVQRQELEICAPLLNWMQAASIGTALGNPLEMGPPPNAIVLNAPTADESLLTQRHAILHQALPGLAAPPQALETALSQVATALIYQTNDGCQVREQRAADALEPKLPSARFAVTLPVLMEYLQVADERNLPDIWHQWANASKKQDIQVLRDALDAFARSPDAYSSSVPIVTAHMTQDLLAFNFVGHSSDDVKGGLHPFIITDGNAEHRQHNVEVARLYGLLTMGDVSVSLSDLEALSAKEVRSVPVTYWELEVTLGMFGNLIGVVLGPTHSLVVAYKEMWQLLRSNIREDLHAALEYRAHVKPTHVLHSIQLGFYSWFTHRRARLTPPTPDFKSIIHQILMHVYVLPMLPLPLYQLAYPKKPTPQLLLPGGSPVPGGSVITTSTSTGSSLSSGTALIVSGLTTSSGGLSQNTGARGARIANLALIQSIAALLPSTVRIKDMMGTTNPPKHDNGAEMCLSFLLRNGCWSNCHRSAQHVSTLSTTEQQCLTQYLTQRLTPAATQASPATSPTQP